jgi:hypothetical protein
MVMTRAATPDRPAKLPLWRSIVWSYARVFTNLGFLIRISWLWLLLMVPLIAAADRYIENARLDGTISDSTSVTLSFLRYYITVPFFTSIAYAWVRMLLLGERQAGVAYLRLDWPVLRLMPISLLGSLYLLAIAVLAKLPWSWLGFWLQAAFNRGMPVFALTFVIAMGLLTIVPAVVSFRLVTALPAMAVGQGAGVLARSWQRTYGNFLRIALGTLAVAAVPGGINAYLGFLNDSDAPTWKTTLSVVESVLGALAELLTAWFLLAFAAFCTRHFDIATGTPHDSAEVAAGPLALVSTGGE